MSKHLKRLAAPRILKISRKVDPWLAKPRAGPHRSEDSIALGVIIRDILKLADKAREAKRIIVSRNIFVDGKVVTDPKYSVGLMDIIYIKTTDKYYRLIYDNNGILRVMSVPNEEGIWKLVKIHKKVTLKGGKTQIILHDGKSILSEEKSYKAGDTLKISLPDLKVIDHYPFKPGSYVLTIGGQNIGKIAKIESYIKTKSTAPNSVKFKEGFESTKENVFVIGTTKAEIRIPEVKLDE
ncbi:MAG: 30S ribosomal protein S4e [Thermoplasmata archaeon]